MIKRAPCALPCQALAVEAPVGIVTFLFTDIEGSTARWEADPDEMRTALAHHDEVLRTAIESRGGHVFKHTGDGVCAAFASPRSAVEAAIEAQRGLPLPVRMGITTGEVERRGDDYFGPPLNRVARLQSLAEKRTGPASLASKFNIWVRWISKIILCRPPFPSCPAMMRRRFPPAFLPWSTGSIRWLYGSLRAARLGWQTVA